MTLFAPKCFFERIVKVSSEEARVVSMGQKYRNPPMQLDLPGATANACDDPVPSRSL